ncbi:AMP-binding protein [Bradyrhizobium japonicum]|uniref:AMP-binding protein n=1 Tax=Bradyrhizobium japonicum TaxID=375 RepID=UPI0020A16DCA|nr:AMP-binding protein [Bradyrhizobium japonicum]MCP1778075.1 non-ribosomal peptide synthetase component E (peptide arylation enzyme) [Bradyrhizobium japonicum]MCP1958928.1 non-ribosomal peptide synthetase component E (peptide arylation enzyme) [Bradyrhizobium japonicum]
MSADPATPHRSPAWPADEPWHLAMPEGALYDALVQAALDRPSHPATVFYGASLSYAELRARVDALAGFLQNACGVKRGDRVMIALQNSPQYVIAYYAVMRADAVIVPINPMNKTAEIAYLRRQRRQGRDHRKRAQRHIYAAGGRSYHAYDRRAVSRRDPGRDALHVAVLRD